MSETSEANTRVYRATTLPLDKEKTSYKTNLKNVQPKKPKIKRRDKSDLGENFIAPDGGWAWLVCIAAGVSNLSIYPCLQQFGFIFRERLEKLGMSSSEVTTIININPAISACTGLLNGPMFRRFSFRQVAVVGSLCIFTGLMLTAFCDTFIGYIVTYSFLFGFGMGISVSASSLAINTYFKNKRRRAAGFSWTITGLGPIFLPYLVTFLISIYGVQGTVLILSSLSLHTLVCALIYQPVENHVTKHNPIIENEEFTSLPIMEKNCDFCDMLKRRNKSIFSSQFLYKDDDEDNPGYEIIEPGTPMLSRANDGWFGSKLSLTSECIRFRTISSSKDLDERSRLHKIILEEDNDKTNEFLKPNNFKREREEVLQKNLDYETPIQYRCTCGDSNQLLDLNKQKLNDGNYLNRNDNKNINNNDGKDDEENKDLKTVEEEEIIKNITFWQKVVHFFDLSLLRDFTYVNLVIGLTIINFGELNFSILTPFILNDFGFTTSQMTFSMSLMACLDILTRFLVPFLTEKISWDNRIFFLIGVVGIALGRTVVACNRSFNVILGCFLWIGICKGIRTIFWPLIIPSYVPLKRLPAASGLQLLISGLFTLLCGPFVGLIRDKFDYSTTIHCLDAMSFIAAISWSTEALINRRKKAKNNL